MCPQNKWSGEFKKGAKIDVLENLLQEYLTCHCYSNQIIDFFVDKSAWGIHFLVLNPVKPKL